jgi:hypothetical protein
LRHEWEMIQLGSQCVDLAGLGMAQLSMVETLKAFTAIDKYVLIRFTLVSTVFEN